MQFIGIIAYVHAYLPKNVNVMCKYRDVKGK